MSSITKIFKGSDDAPAYTPPPTIVYYNATPATSTVSTVSSAATVDKSESSASEAEKKRALNAIRARKRTVVNEGGQSGLAPTADKRKALLGD